MDTMPSPTTLIADALQPGWSSFHGLNCEIEPIQDSAEIERDWNGRAIVMADPLFRLYRIRLFADGEHKPAALGGLWPGEIIPLVVPPVYLAGSIDRASYGDPQVLPDERTYRRYQFKDMMVMEPWRIAEDEAGVRVRWEIVLEELQHPSLYADPEPEE